MTYKINTLFASIAAAAVLLLPSFAAQAATGFTVHQVQAASGSGSKERNYSYYVPASYSAGKPAPLYVVLHGCRQTDRTMTDLAGMETYADRDGAIVLYPFQNNDASSNDNDGRNPNCWGYWYAANIHRDQGEPSDIKRMVDTIKSKFTINSDRVHITGISSGGAMATIVQVTYPDVFASAVMVEGIGYAETSATYTGTTPCQTVLDNNLGVVRATSSVIADMRAEMGKSILRQPPVLVMHNKKDCTVPIKIGLSLIDTFLGLRAADGLGISSTPTSSFSSSVDGLPYTWSKYGNDGKGNSLVETVIHDATEKQVISAGVVVLNTDIWDPSGASDKAVKEDTVRGHWWPGAAKRGAWIINKGINGAQVAADFFKAHPMNAVAGTTTTTAANTTTTAANTTTTAAATTTTAANTTTTALSTTTTSVKATTTTSASATTTTTASTTTTTKQATGSATCFTASNVSHVLAGRGYYSFGFTRAYGSYDQMGTFKSSTITTLKKTGPYHYAVGSCP